jgi:peptidyl-prolyl cis-trans isomerase D
MDRNMLTGIRNVTRGWIAGGLLALLAGSFAIWGVEDMLKPTRSNEVASGRGVAISVNEFTRLFENAIDENKERLKRSITKQEAFDGGLATQVINNMIAEQSIDALARKAGYAVPNAMLASTIRQQKEFRNQITGKFDKEQYFKLLQMNKLTDQQFTQDLRARLLRRQFAEAVIGGLRAPSSITALQIAYQTEQRTLSIAAIDPNRFGPPPEPTEADLKAYYEENKSGFRTPELRKLTIVKARPDAFAAKVDVPEDKIKQLYDFRTRGGGAGEQRSFVQISAPDQAAANEAARRLAAGDDPQKVAAAVKGQVLSFDAVTKESVPDPAVGEAVFGLKKGQSTGAIHGKLAWAAARVTDIKAGAGPSYESMHDDLRAELAKQEAADLLQDAVDKFDQARTGGMPVEEAAKNSGLDVIEIDKVSAQGATAQGGPAPVVGETPDLLKAAFQAPADEPTDFVPTQDGGYALVRVDKIYPPGVRTFDEVKPILEQGWKSQKIGDQMRALSDAVKKAVEGGKSFAAAAAANKLHVVAASQKLDRRAIQMSDIPALVQQAFAAKEGDIVTAPDRSGSVLLVAQVEKIERPDPAAEPQMMAQATAQLSDGMTSDFLFSLETYAKAKAKVKVNETLLKQSQGVEDEKSAAAP